MNDLSEMHSLLRRTLCAPDNDALIVFTARQNLYLCECYLRTMTGDLCVKVKLMLYRDIDHTDVKQWMIF